MADKNISIEASKLILGDTDKSDVFWVKFLWFKIRLSIPYLSGNRIVKISRHIAKIDRPDVDAPIFPEMMRTAEKAIINECKAIAVATGSRIPLLYKLIGRGTPKDIYTLLGIVKKKSNQDSYYQAIILAQGLDKLKPKDNSGEEILSSEGLQ